MARLYYFSTLQMTASLPPNCLNPQAYAVFLFYSQCSCIQDLSGSLVLSQVRKIKFPFDLHFSLPMAILSQRAMPPLPNGLLGGHSLPDCDWRLPGPYGRVPLSPTMWAGVLFRPSHVDRLPGLPRASCSMFWVNC